MDKFDLDTPKRTWTKIIMWWELRRIVYNIVMLAAGYLSFYIGYVTLPLLYLVIGFGFNVIYTLGWLLEILFVKNFGSETFQKNYPKRAFLIYLAFSILLVFALPTFAIYG